MTPVKIDHPRSIDQFIDYFGEPRRPASNLRPRPDPRILRGSVVLAWIASEPVRPSGPFSPRTTCPSSGSAISR
jgi:hypothetical protein